MIIIITNIIVVMVNIIIMIIGEAKEFALKEHPTLKV